MDVPVVRKWAIPSEIVLFALHPALLSPIELRIWGEDVSNGQGMAQPKYVFDVRGEEI